MSAPIDLAAVSAADASAAARRAGHKNPMLGFGPGAFPGLPADRLCVAWPGASDGVASPGASDGVASPGASDGVAAAADLVDAVGGWVGTRERRVAASLVVLGYAARLVGPTLAVLLRDGIVLDARPSQVRYSYRPEHGFRLMLPYPGGWRGRPDALHARWCRDILDLHLSGLIGTVRAVVPVASGLLWGNVASGLAGALHALVRDGDVPLAAGQSSGQVLLSHTTLRGSGTLAVHEGQLRFVRRSCCLYYRLDGGGMCGDCPLTLAHRDLGETPVVRSPSTGLDSRSPR